ncbi:hypothetical protein ANN_03273 [Periplaneta americana]|uniref:Endonuclease/exonuclease/phosphatase domain-containing protein n=1 Tax=Periplaneta americana TaxID=6978 RepID=A0ABQ8U1E4_PERAM|nr:hypothetical protein ANN_03273 [Periplaneta americana]
MQDEIHKAMSRIKICFASLKDMLNDNIKGNSTPQDETIFNSDILILYETFLQEPRNINGFHAAHVLAKVGPEGRPSGGVSCYYNRDLGQAKNVETRENTVIIQLNNLQIAGIYIRPQSSADEVIEIIMTAQDQIDPEIPTLLAGDLSCRIDRPNSKSEAFLELMEEEGFTLINEAQNKTYISHNVSSTINLVFHRGNEIKCRSITTTTVSASTPIRKHLPSTPPQPTKRKSKPWFDSECYTTRNLVLEKLQEMKKTNKNYENLRLGYMHIKIKYNSLLKAKKQEYTQIKEEELLREAEIKPYRVLEPRRTKVTPSIAMTVWERHFADLLQKKNSHYHTEGRNSLTANERITEEEVWQAIERSKPRKAAGPDNISNLLLKGAMIYTGKIWAAIYNKCLQTSEIPTIWRESTVKVIYKGKGPQNTPQSYRGIALDCAPFKIMNNIILKKIHDSIMTVMPLEQRFPNFSSHGALFEAKVSRGAPRNVYFLVLSVYVV